MSDLLKLILKSKRIIKIIKKISGLKNIVLDNQINATLQKLKLHKLTYEVFSSFVLKVLSILSDEVIAKGINKSQAEKPINTNFFFKHH